MKNYKVLRALFCFLMLVFSYPVFSKPVGMTATVTIIVEDSNYRKGLEVEFIMNQNGINTSYSGYIKSYRYTLKNLVSKFTIPLSTGLNYGRIALSNPSDSFKYWDMPMDASNDLFIFEDNDDVIIRLGTYKNQASFSGKSAAKFKCMFGLNNISDDLKTKVYNYYYALGDHESALNAVKRQCDSLFRVKTEVLEAANLNPQVNALIKLDIWAECSQKAIGSAYIVFQSRKGNKKEWFPHTKKFIFSNFGKSFQYPKVDEKLMAQSYKAGDFLSLREKAYAFALNSSDTSSYYNQHKFRPIWDALQKHYKNGLLKDKVTLVAFINFDRRREGDVVNYLDSAVQFAKPSALQLALKNFRLANMAGERAFPFALYDTQGKLISLNDLQGKLIVLDFWFTGCTGCLQMAKVLQPIVASYKGNQDIAFVSVNTDRNPSTWKHSVDEEKYSTKDEINLIAENGAQSKIIQYYNVNAFPSLIFISKNGTLITTAPPDPRIDLEAFKNLLEKSLK